MAIAAVLVLAGHVKKKTSPHAPGREFSLGVARNGDHDVDFKRSISPGLSPVKGKMANMSSSVKKDENQRKSGNFAQALASIA